MANSGRSLDTYHGDSMQETHVLNATCTERRPETRANDEMSPFTSHRQSGNMADPAAMGPRHAAGDGASSPDKDQLALVLSALNTVSERLSRLESGTSSLSTGNVATWRTERPWDLSTWQRPAGASLIWPKQCAWPPNPIGIMRQAWQYSGRSLMLASLCHHSCRQQLTTAVPLTLASLSLFSYSK